MTSETKLSPRNAEALVEAFGIIFESGGTWTNSIHGSNTSHPKTIDEIARIAEGMGIADPTKLTPDIPAKDTGQYLLRLLRGNYLSQENITINVELREVSRPRSKNEEPSYDLHTYWSRHFD